MRIKKPSYTKSVGHAPIFFDPNKRTRLLIRLHSKTIPGGGGSWKRYQFIARNLRSIGHPGSILCHRAKPRDGGGIHRPRVSDRRPPAPQDQDGRHRAESTQHRTASHRLSSKASGQQVARSLARLLPCALLALLLRPQWLTRSSRRGEEMAFWSGKRRGVE